MNRSMIVFKCDRCSIIQFGNPTCTVDGLAMSPFDLSHIDKHNLVMEDTGDKLNRNKRNKKSELDALLIQDYNGQEENDDDEMNGLDESIRLAVQETVNDLVTKIVLVVADEQQNQNHVNVMNSNSNKPPLSRQTSRPNSVNKKVFDVASILESSRTLFDFK
jgi:hypothetical protein